MEERDVARFWSKVDRGGPDDCWQWNAGKNYGGYGKFAVGRRGAQRHMGAHQFAYEITHGPVPTGYQLDHTCHDPATCAGGPTCPHRSCVNPAHLEAVTPQTNVLRGNTLAAKGAAATHCPKGHPYDEENTRIARSGQRCCRECERLRARENQRRKRAMA